MQAWHRSLPTATLPTVYSQYPLIEGLFGVTNSTNSSQLEQGRNLATSSSIETTSQPLSVSIPNYESTQLGHDASEIECVVCSTEPEIAMEVPTEACSHPPQVCIQCLQQVILAAIESGDFIVGILCPSYGCPHRLGYYDVRKWATQETFERYDRLLFQDSLRADGSYVSCVGPNCTAGQEHTGGEDNVIVTCHQCGTKQCFRHQIPWHEGLTCDQWEAQQDAMTNQQEEKTEEWVQARTKPCPGCGRRIEKISGCDHFMCKRPGGCGHQFCWECLAPWLQIIAGDNSRHYDTCRYYTGLPGGNPAPTQIVAATTLRPPLQPQGAPHAPLRSPPPPLAPIHDFTNLFRPLDSPPRHIMQRHESIPQPDILATGTFRTQPPAPSPPTQPAIPPTRPAFTNPFVPARPLSFSTPRHSELPHPALSALGTTELPMRAPYPTIPQNAIPGSSSEPRGFSRMPGVTNLSYRPPGPSAFSHTNNSNSMPFYPGLGTLHQSQNAAEVPNPSPSTYNAASILPSTCITGLSRTAALSDRSSPRPSTSSAVVHSNTTSINSYAESMMTFQVPASSSSDLRTVAQIRDAATLKTNNAIKGASSLISMRALQRLAESAHLKERQGDLRGALFQFVQVGVLLRFVQTSHDYTQQVQNGRQGELYQLMQEFIAGPFQGMLKSVRSLQQTLLREEQVESGSTSAASHMLGNGSVSSVGRQTGGSLADRLRQLQGTSIQVEYRQPSRVGNSLPTLHGPVPGPSTIQRPPVQIQPRDSTFNDVHWSNSPHGIPTITPQELQLCLERTSLTVLILDVRTREQFERERINHRAVVWLDPAIFMRPNLNAAMIEAWQVISPSTEQAFFKNRSKFDLVIMYDENSTNPRYPTLPLSLLSRVIFMGGYYNPLLKRPPMVLMGGIEAWKAAIGDKGVIRPPVPPLTVQGLTSAFQTSPIDEETLVYPRPTGVRGPSGAGASEPGFSSIAW